METSLCPNCGRDRNPEAVTKECVCDYLPFAEDWDGANDEYDDDDEEEDFATEVRNLERNPFPKGTSHGNWNY